MFVNIVYDTGSTGRIVKKIADTYKKMGAEVLVAYGRNKQAESDSTYYFGNKISFYWHVIMSMFFGRHGLHSTRETKNLIQKIKDFNPDTIHLHNLHGYYLNVKLLMSYLKTTDIKIVYVQHDCWTVSGSAAHFDYYGCKEWDDGCIICNNTKEYPKALFIKRQRKNFKWKKEVFSDHKDMIIITVSDWMSKLISKTYLSQYEIRRIYNGVDLDVFSRKEELPRKKEKIELLGVASVWTKQKGLDDFISLSRKLDSKYRLTLIGLSKRQLKLLPPNINGVARTSSVKELAEYYKTADIYLNLSVEETMGLTTVEALACGTPCIVFDRTAVPEIITSETGVVVEANNIDQLFNAIESFDFKNLTTSKARKRSLFFSEEIMLRNYVLLDKIEQ